MDIRHISGAKNVGSDYLSRIPPDKRGTIYSDQSKSAQVATLDGHKLVSMDPALLFEHQQACEEIKNIKKGLHSPKLKFDVVKFSDYELFCEMTSAHPRPYLPEPLRHFVISQLHGLDHKRQKESNRRVAAHYF